MEVKREMHEGELSSSRKAALPIIAALRRNVISDINLFTDSTKDL